MPYVSAVGKLMYVMLCAKLDITFIVGVTNRHQVNLEEKHWLTMKSIFKYLRRTNGLVLSNRCSELNIQGYLNFDIQLGVDDKNSTLRFIFICNKSAVSQKSFKQLVTADSTTKAKYITISKAAKKVLWICKFVSELVVVPNII